MADHGLGVEMLMGSGLIADESSLAYDQTFALTYVLSTVGRHAGSIPTRKATVEILKATTVPIGSSLLLWRWAVLTVAISVTVLGHSGQSTTEMDNNNERHVQETTQFPLHMKGLDPSCCVDNA